MTNIFQNSKMALGLMLLLFLIILFVTPVFADGLVQCGGPDEDLCTICDIPVVISNLITFVIKDVVFPLALVLVIVGGFMILTAGPSPTRIETGKKILTNTLIGVLIILFSWIIVNFIFLIMTGQGGFNDIRGALMPWNALQSGTCALGGQITTQPISTGDPGSTGNGGTTGGSTPPPPQVTSGKMSAKTARDTLRQNGVSVNKNECPAGTRYQDVVGGCTSTEGVLASTVQGVINFKNECKCNVVVTGGTELGHTDGPNGHASGKKVDLQRNPTLDNYITSKYTYAGVRGNDGAKLYKSPSGAVFAKESNHWDVKGWDVQF